MGATGSAGDGLLKAAIEDPEVKKVYVLTRRSSARIDKGVASGRVEMRIHKDFTDYSEHDDWLKNITTVLWGLGTSSLQVDEATYTLIHVDFPIAFMKAWTTARQQAPMALHYITGMGTDGNAKWAQDKRKSIQEMSRLAEPIGARVFDYRSGWISPASEKSNPLIYVFEWMVKPGALVIPGKDLGNAMLEISARTKELANGTVLDNKDSIRYAKAHKRRNK